MDAADRGPLWDTGDDRSQVFAPVAAAQPPKLTLHWGAARSPRRPQSPALMLFSFTTLSQRAISPRTKRSSSSGPPPEISMPCSERR